MAFGSDFKKAGGPDETDLSFSFPVTTTVGSAAVDRASRRMQGTSVTYAATGVYTCTLPTGVVFPSLPYTVQVTAQSDTVGHAFHCYPVGEITQVAGVMTLVLQTYNSSLAAVAPAAAAGCRINVTITGTINGGK